MSSAQDVFACDSTAYWIGDTHDPLTGGPVGVNKTVCELYPWLSPWALPGQYLWVPYTCKDAHGYWTAGAQHGDKIGEWCPKAVAFWETGGDPGGCCLPAPPSSPPLPPSPPSPSSPPSAPPPGIPVAAIVVPAVVGVAALAALLAYFVKLRRPRAALRGRAGSPRPRQSIDTSSEYTDKALQASPGTTGLPVDAPSASAASAASAAPHAEISASEVSAPALPLDIAAGSRLDLSR